MINISPNLTIMCFDAEGVDVDTSEYGFAWYDSIALQSSCRSTQAVPSFKLALAIVEEGREAAQQVLNHAADLVICKGEKYDPELFLYRRPGCQTSCLDDKSLKEHFKPWSATQLKKYVKICGKR